MLILVAHHLPLDVTMVTPILQLVSWTRPLSLGSRLSIKDYKRPLGKGLEHFHIMVFYQEYIIYECRMLDRPHTNILDKVESVNYCKSTHFVHTLYSWQRLLIGDDNTEDDILYMAFITEKGFSGFSKRVGKKRPSALLLYRTEVKTRRHLVCEESFNNTELFQLVSNIIKIYSLLSCHVQAVSPAIGFQPAFWPSSPRQTET